MKHEINKQPLTFYTDYVIQDGKCYIHEEMEDGRQKNTYICNTDKERCETIFEQDNKVIIEI